MRELRDDPPVAEVLAGLHDHRLLPAQRPPYLKQPRAACSGGGWPPPGRWTPATAAAGDALAFLYRVEHGPRAAQPTRHALYGPDADMRHSHRALVIDLPAESRPARRCGCAWKGVRRGGAAVGRAARPVCATAWCTWAGAAWCSPRWRCWRSSALRSGAAPGGAATRTSARCWRARSATSRRSPATCAGSGAGRCVRRRPGSTGSSAAGRGVQQPVHRLLHGPVPHAPVLTGSCTSRPRSPRPPPRLAVLRFDGAALDRQSSPCCTRLRRAAPAATVLSVRGRGAWCWPRGVR